VERFTWWLKEKGADYDTVNAVLGGAKAGRALDETLPRLAEKVFALQRLREQPEFAALVEIHRRCRNILEQADGGGKGKPESSPGWTVRPIHGRPASPRSFSRASSRPRGAWAPS
jgi:glycyl-tRNA synthetase beta subunit